MSQNVSRTAVILSLCAALMLASCTLSAQDTLPFFQPGKIRVLIFSGRNNHDWRTTTPFLRKILVDSGRFDVRVEEEPAGITAATLAAYDVLVIDYEGPRWGEVTEKAVENFVKQGKGLVAVHGANYTFTGLEVLADNHKPSGLKQAALARVFADDWRVVDARPAQDRPRAAPLLHGKVRRPRASHHPRFAGVLPHFR